MEITIRSVVELHGEINSQTAPRAQATLLPLCHDQCQIVLDMSNVSYMSSAGLRVLLTLYRQVSSAQGKLVFVGLSEELQDTLSSIGFLNQFTTTETLEAGLALLT